LRCESVVNCSLEAGSINIADSVRMSNVSIKAESVTIDSSAVLANCKLFSDGPVTIGACTEIKDGALINSFKSITIGDRSIIDRDVRIAGMQSEKSEIEIGSDCAVLYRSYLNTTRKISIGNNVGIGGYCLIFTHSAWQNALEGGLFKFSDVIIEDSVWIPWNVTVLPGITIGKNTIIGTGSVVTKSLPESVFAAGSPAKIISRRENQPLTYERKNSIMLEILSDFQNFVSDYLKLNATYSVNSRGSELELDGKRLCLTADFSEIRESDIVISFSIPEKLRNTGVEWIELDTLLSHTSSELAGHFISFVRRYGLRIVPI